MAQFFLHSAFLRKRSPLTSVMVGSLPSFMFSTWARCDWPCEEHSTFVEWVEPGRGFSEHVTALSRGQLGDPKVAAQASFAEMLRPAVKAQLPGPLTLRALGHDPRRVHLLTLATTTLTQRCPSLRELWLDEPVVEGASDLGELDEAFRALRARFPDLRLGVHACGKAPLDKLARIGFDVIHADGEHCADAMAEVSAECEVVWGLVPTDGSLDRNQLRRRWDFVSERAQGAIRRIAPACGLGTRSRQQVWRVVSDLRWACLNLEALPTRGDGVQIPFPQPAPLEVEETR